MPDNEEKHTERLIQLYENKSKNFEKYFAILIGFSLFVFFFMLLPYVYLQISERGLILQLEINHQKLNKNLSDINFLNETREKITNGNLTFNKQITILSEEYQKLYDYLISNTSNSVIIQNNSITVKNECERVYNNTQQWIYCNLNHKSIDIKKTINDVLYREIIIPLNNLNTSKSSSVQIDLDTIIENIQTNLYRLNFIIVSNNSDIFKRSFINQINSINDEVEKIYHVIDNKINELNIEIKDINNTVLDLEEKLDKLQIERNDVKDLLNDFESPIGKLTVGFDHVILIFPLILLGGFIFCISVLIDANATRKILLRNYKIRFGEERKESDDKIAEEKYMFPIFIDKINNIKILVLFIPFMIFIISCILIVLSWINFTESTFGYDKIYRHIFLILYIIFGIVAGVISMLQLREIKRIQIQK